MTEVQIQATLLGLLTAIAPEMEAALIDPTRPLRDQIDIDSMDFLNFLIAVAKEFGVEIPESDYGQVSSLDALAKYVSRHGVG